MFVLISKTVFMAKWFIFPMVSISEYAIPNLTQVQCEKLSTKIEKEKSESSFLFDVDLNTKVTCLKVD